MKLGRGASALMGSIITLFIPAFAFAAIAGAPAPDTAQSALGTEDAINQAFLTSNAGALETLLAGDWIVVSGFGGIAQRNDFIAYVRGGNFTRKKMVLSDPRVRLYGNTAVVTTHLNASGRSIEEANGKIVTHCFDVKERQTDVLVWQDGSWKSVLLHETVIPGTLHLKVLPGSRTACP
jgi:hypothetical protein